VAKSREKKPARKKPSNKLVAKPLGKRRSTSVSVTQPDPLLQAYLREVQKYPLLTREEEHDLAVSYREKGDREALHRLVTGNLRFVVKIAYEYVHYRAKLLDLIQEGNMGLVKAVQEFNPYKDVRLTTYAVWWIRSYIQDAILRNYSLVKIGTTQAQKRLFYRLRAEQKKLEGMGMVPAQSTKLLASRLDVREKDVQEMDQRLSQGDLSLNAPTGGEENKDHLQRLADPAEPVDQALGDVEQKELFKRILNQFAETLEGREKVVFNDRLISESPLTLQELGEKYGVTKERARQIEEQVKTKLKNYVREHYPDFQLLAPEG
jgi:RNA polymerase sigma-32 factor